MKSYELYYEQEAPYAGEDTVFYSHGTTDANDGWEKWSLPLGNGYMGINVFGRTAVERLQITENSLCNPYVSDKRFPGGNGGLQSFCDIYLDFNHKDISDYHRSLSLNDAIARTEYKCGGIVFSREHFASYPDRVFVTRLTADTCGALSFTVRPHIPFVSPYLLCEGDGMGRTGTVHAEDGKLVLFGEMEYYGIKYEAQIFVCTNGGELITHERTIEVKGADSALLLFASGTNYRCESRVFTEQVPSKKLLPYEHPHKKVSEIIAKAKKIPYEELLSRHLRDYRELISRAEIDLGGIKPSMTTDALIAHYRANDDAQSENMIDIAYNRYLEEMYFTYGRYLLISSSRPNTYPANLQGTWCKYAIAPWSAGYWHNINVQMNYWPAFNTNLHELFLPYLEYFKAYRACARQNADAYVAETFPENHSLPGHNGISIGTGGWLYKISGIPAADTGHSGPGTSAFTAKLFTDYYEFSLNETHLADTIYPANRETAVFLSKTLEEQSDGTLLVKHSASPEQSHNGTYYHTKGCAFDQQMVFECYGDTLKLSAVLGIRDAFTERLQKDIARLDPVQIGASGQIKEFREETHYGDIGEYHHRHISHLVGLYPGTCINAKNQAWIKAAEKTLNERGDVSTGWSTAHKMNAWARTKNGKRAYDLLRILLSKCTLPNLWDSHPPFQIDGNLGGTAGIAEMLLQSHEGYIHVLPALPPTWSNGSFTGLCARGGYTVSAFWHSQKLYRVCVTAARAGKLKILLRDATELIERDVVAGEIAVLDL